MSFYVKLWEKELLEKMILVLEKSLNFFPKILCEQCDISGLACLNKLNIGDIALGFQLVFWASSSHILLGQGHFLLILVTVNDWFLLEDDLPGLLPIGQVSFKCYLLINKNNILVANNWTELFRGWNSSLYKVLQDWLWK